MTDRERMEEILSLYALGALEGEELMEAEELLKKPEAREVLREFEDVKSLLPYAARTATPSPELKKRILAEIKSASRREERKEETPLFAKFWTLAFGVGGAFAAAALVAVLIWNISLRKELNQERVLVSQLNERVTGQEDQIKSLNNLLTQKEGEIGSLETELASLEEITEFMEDPHIVLVDMKNPHPGHPAAGRVLWDTDENDALFYCLDLPAPPPGKTYQWWIVADGTTKSIGVFQADSDGNSVVKVDSLKKYGDDIDHFTLTLEPKGGALAPSDTSILASEPL